MNNRILLISCMILLATSLAAAQLSCSGNFAVGSSYYDICIKVVEVGCLILAILQGIIAFIAVLVLVLAGFQWTSSAFFEDAQRRAEAKEKIIQVIVGLAIALVAVRLVIFLFGGGLGSFSC